MSEQSKSSLTPVLIFATFVTCFGSSLLYGYNLSVLNLPGPAVKCFFNNTILNTSCTTKTDAVVKYAGSNNSKTELKKDSEDGFIDDKFLYGMVNSAFVIAGALGAFATGWIADFFGRRNGLMFNSIFAIIGGIITGPTVYAQAPALIYFGRFVIGINCGVTIGLASMYLMEIAPRDVRGAIGACHQLAVTIGIVVGNLLTLDSALNTKHLWSVAQALTAVPAVIGLMLLPCCPESPRYLFVNKGLEAESRKAFLKVNQVEDVDHFISEMKTELEASKVRAKFSFSQLFTKKDLRMPLLIACLIQVMQQLSGVNAVVGYSGTLLETAGVKPALAQYFVVGIGIWNVLCTIVSLPLIERAGRRTLLLIPSAILGLSLILLIITVNLQSNPNVNKQIVSVAAVIGCYIFMAAFALGLGPIPAMIVSEVTRQETRAAAYSVSQALQWISNLIVMSSYPSLNGLIGGWVFMVYLSVLVCCFIFFYLFMPETRNRTFDDVARDLAFGRRQVGRRHRTLEFQEEPLANGMDMEANGKPSDDNQIEGVPLVDRRKDNVVVA